MMAVDASALCAICLNEPEGRAFEAALIMAQRPIISAVNLWEVRVTIAKRDPDPVALEILQALVETSGLRIVPISDRELELAWEAWRRLGKGRHPAALNLGDCFAYGTARSAGLPLLYKGNDFAQTDIAAATNYPP